MYYKVVTTCMRSAVYHPGCIYYELDKWVEPTIEDSYLFVFDSLEAAEDYVRSMYYDYTFNIYECEVEGINPDINTMLHMGSSYVHEVRHFWKNYRPNKEQSYYYAQQLIKGTVFAKKVKLTKNLGMAKRKEVELPIPSFSFA